MNRGSKLFNSFFNKPEPEGNEKGRGRSTSLIALRNSCIIDRFYFYGQYTDKRYVKIIQLLQEDFFLAERTIYNIIENEYNLLLEVKKQAPPKHFFKRKWSNLNWDF